MPRYFDEKELEKVRRDCRDEYSLNECDCHWKEVKEYITGLGERIMAERMRHAATVERLHSCEKSFEEMDFRAYMEWLNE